MDSFMETGSTRRQMINITLLGVGFMFVFTAFQTAAMTEVVVLNGFKGQRGFEGHEGYYSLAIIYVALAAANWIAPSVVELVGPKLSMIPSALFYTAFVANFIYPTVIGIYALSALLGVAAAILWVAQGKFLTVNSNRSNISRNAGIFWAFFTLSMIWGNVFAFFELRDQTTISESLRHVLYAVLSVVSLIGIGCLCFVTNSGGSEEDLSGQVSSRSAARVTRDAFVDAVKLLGTADMLMLLPIFLYSGLELTFYSGVYGTSIGFTKLFGDSAKSLVPLAGICIGIGEFTGGGLFGIYGQRSSGDGDVVGGEARDNFCSPRDRAILIGIACQFTAFFIAFINLPSDSSLGATSSIPLIGHPSIALAMIGAFLLGFGDACFNTKLMETLSTRWSDRSAPAYAIFKFAQSLSCGGAFFYSAVFDLRIQLGIMIAVGTVAAISFFFVDYRLRARESDPFGKAASDDSRAILHAD